MINTSRTEMPDELISAWRLHLKSIENVINRLETEINQQATLGNCSLNWCRETETIISEIDRSLNALGTSIWMDNGDQNYVANLKVLISDLYSSFYTASRIT